jgi:hypothetical protein
MWAFRFDSYEGEVAQEVTQLSWRFRRNLWVNQEIERWEVEG